MGKIKKKNPRSFYTPGIWDGDTHISPEQQTNNYLRRRALAKRPLLSRAVL
jgi:hypothetical protein